MSHLHLIEKDQATGKVAGIYENMMNTMGFIPNAFKVYSPSEHILEQQVNNLVYFMRHSSLSGKLLALMRLLISDVAKCEYCIGVNTGILFQYGILPETVAEIRKNPASAPLDPKELAILLFVLKVIGDSNSITAVDVDQLRSIGWSDAEILEATYHGTSQVASDMLFNAFRIEKDF